VVRVDGIGLLLPLAPTGSDAPHAMRACSVLRRWRPIMSKVCLIVLTTMLACGSVLAQPATGAGTMGQTRSSSRSSGVPLDRGPFTPEANSAYQGGGMILQGAPGAPSTCQGTCRGFGRLRIVVEAAHLILLDPDPDQVARNVMPLGEPMHGFAGK
jgi:hypothetical protein